MQQDIPGMNDTPHLPGDIPNEGVDPFLNEDIEPSLSGQAEQETPFEHLSPQESAELAESLTPGPGEDSILLVETIALPDTAEAALPEEVYIGAIDLDIAPPWYQSRWFYISAGVVGTALAGAGTLLLLQGLRKRNRQLFWSRQAKKTLRPPSLPSMRQVSSRAQGRLSQMTSQFGGTSSKSLGQIQKQLKWLTGQTQHVPDRMRMLRSSKLQPSGTGQSLGTFTRRTGSQFNALSAKARTTTARATSQVQHNLASLGTGVSTGFTKTGETLQRSWKLGRTFALGMGAGAVWASLFTPQSGEKTRARLTETVQRSRKTKA